MPSRRRLVAIFKSAGRSRGISCLLGREDLKKRLSSLCSDLARYSRFDNAHHPAGVETFPFFAQLQSISCARRCAEADERIRNVDVSIPTRQSALGGRVVAYSDHHGSEIAPRNFCDAGVSPPMSRCLRDRCIDCVHLSAQFACWAAIKARQARKS